MADTQLKNCAVRAYEADIMTVAANTPIELIKGGFAPPWTPGWARPGRGSGGFTRPTSGPTPRPPRFSPAPAPVPGGEPGPWATGPAAAPPPPANAKAGPRLLSRPVNVTGGSWR